MHAVKKVLALLFAVGIFSGCTEATTPAAEPVAKTKAFDGIELSQISDAAHGLIVESLELGDVGDFFDANRAAREATEKDPEAVFAWIRLANTATSGEEFAESLKRARGMRAQASRGEILLADMAHASFIENDTAKGMRLAEELTRLHPESPRTWLALAGVQAAANDHEKARATAMKAAKLAPGHIAPHVFLGNSYLFNAPKDFVKAEAHMTKVTQRRPRAASAWVGLGDVHRGMVQLEKARAAYTRALELQPGHAIASVKRAHVNSFLDKYDDARADYDQSLATGSASSQASLANYRAFVHLHGGKAQGALDELEALLKKIDGMSMSAKQKNSARIFVLQNLATICFHTQQKALAQDTVERLSKAYDSAARNVGDPDFARTQKAAALYWQGKLAAYTGDYVSAEAKAKAYADLRKPEKNPRKLENYHEILGLVHLRQKKFQKAAEHYRQSNLTSLGAGDVFTKYHLAEALAGAGKKIEARELYKEVADWGFNSAGYALVRREAAKRAGAN